jgi:hypothetical protein
MRILHAILGVSLATAALVGLLSLTPLQSRGPWVRKHPLQNPIEVKSIGNGRLTLSDGRVLAPAGIVRSAEVTPDRFDAVLRVATRQGVEVLTDFGDGRAFLMAEPKYFNWCGNSNRRWPGSYLRAPLSEMMIWAGVAEPRLDEPGLTTVQKWRLEGATQLRTGSEMLMFDETQSSFQYSAEAESFVDYEEYLKMAWKPRPAD